MRKQVLEKVQRVRRHAAVRKRHDKAICPNRAKVGVTEWLQIFEKETTFFRWFLGSTRQAPLDHDRCQGAKNVDQCDSGKDQVHAPQRDRDQSRNNLAREL